MASSVVSQGAVSADSEDQTEIAEVNPRHGMCAKITTITWIGEADESYTRAQQKPGEVKIQINGASWSVMDLANGLEKLARKLRR